MRTKEPLPNISNWTFDLLRLYEDQLARIASDYHLSTYPNQIEIISAEQMIDAYASIGMPIGYHHWSFGKQFLTVEKHYKYGHMGLAYEIVINSNPCITYLMEENSLVMQALVMAHACYGHNSFFKNNYLFKSWTNADSIIDYLVFAKNYIASCEEKYGIDQVEELLDACHALMNFGVDRYKHPQPLTLHKEKIRQQKRALYLQSQVNELWRTIPQKSDKTTEHTHKVFPEEPQENLLYFIEKHAPLLESWQREIIRIVRKIAQYFYPQRQTKVMNEGWACFWHYTLINHMYDEGLLTDDFMLEFLQHHTNVIYQVPFNDPHYSGINPYTLGFNMMKDIKRICENPSEEDKKFFPAIANKDWLSTLTFAMENFKDESFIAQYLSPHLIRELKLFSLLDDEKNNDYIITAIHNEEGYKHIREVLSNQNNIGYTEPYIQVYRVDVQGDRSLVLRYQQYHDRPLHASAERVLKYAYQLWGFPVHIETINLDGRVTGKISCPTTKS